MKLNNVDLIVVPDVHGRTFWENVFKYDTEIVFLGDYLDPYSFENIYPWDALDNFAHILTFAKMNPNVHLLLGNHDLAYANGLHVCKSRTDKKNYDEIRRMFVDNKDLFSLAYDCTINGKTFFISHAGITPSWCELHSDIFDRPFSETLCADYINRLYREGKLDSVLGDVSRHRYGSDKSGSIVWADIYDHAEDQGNHKTDVIQIVGHTQCTEFPIQIKHNYVYLNLYIFI